MDIEFLNKRGAGLSHLRRAAHSRSIFGLERYVFQSGSQTVYIRGGFWRPGTHLETFEAQE